MPTQWARYSTQLEAAILRGKGGDSFTLLSPKSFALKTGPRSKGGTPKDILEKIKRAMRSPSSLEMNMQGMRDLRLFRRVLEGLSPKQVESIVTKMNKAPFDMPIRIEYSPSGSFTGKNVVLVDGRHRLQAAREFGALKILARIIVRDDEGDVVSDTKEIIPTGGKMFRIVDTGDGRELKRR